MSGITFFINQQARYRNFDNVYAAIMMIGIIGLTTDMALAWLGKGLFPVEAQGPGEKIRADPVSMVAKQNRRESELFEAEPAPLPGSENFGRLEPPVARQTPAQVSLRILIHADRRSNSPIITSRTRRLPRASRRIRETPGRALGAESSKGLWVRSDHQHIVFDKVSLDIHRREFVSIIGPSGCGKSTLHPHCGGTRRSHRRRDAP